MDDIKLNAFPSNSTEALAMLYMQSQDLQGKSPEEICEMYWDVFFRIHNCSAQYRKAAYESHKQ